MKTRITAPARRQADRLDRWWREHRPATADLFARELETALQLIADTPEMGAPHVARRGSLVRRVLLPKTRNHLYYEMDREHDVVLIVAIWGAPKGRGPKL